MLIPYYEIISYNLHSYRVPQNFCTLLPIWKKSVHKALPLSDSASVFKKNRDEGEKHQDEKKSWGTG